MMMKNNNLTKIITGACLASLGTQIIAFLTYIDILRGMPASAMLGWFVFALVILAIGAYIMDDMVRGVVLLLCGLQIMFLELAMAFTSITVGIFSIVFIIGAIIAIIGGASIVAYSKK